MAVFPALCSSQATPEPEPNVPLPRVMPGNLAWVTPLQAQGRPHVSQLHQLPLPPAPPWESSRPAPELSARSPGSGISQIDHRVPTGGTGPRARPSSRTAGPGPVSLAPSLSIFRSTSLPSDPHDPDKMIFLKCRKR